MIEEPHLDDERTVLFYEALLEKHGNSFRALNWGSAKSQRKRFEVLSKWVYAQEIQYLMLVVGLQIFMHGF